MMLFRYVFTVYSLVLTGCAERPSYPPGGYPYPEYVAAKDSNLYFYPLRNIRPPMHAFHDSYAYTFYRHFGEPNLSIKPQSKETLRLTIGTYVMPYIISVTEDLISVKTGNPSNLYVQDRSRLSELENAHLDLLSSKYPLDTAGKKPWVKKYLDSLTKAHPQLLDVNYFHTLYEKSYTTTGEKFSYHLSRHRFTKSEFQTLSTELSSSGFWSLPADIECKEHCADGGGYTIEANTKRKYQTVSFSSCCNDTSQLPKVCQKIVSLAKLEDKINLIGIDSLVVIDVQLQQVSPPRKSSRKKRK